MTCQSCGTTVDPGAWCANGHPPRRARRLSGDEKRAAEARREAERTHAALVEVARPVVESAQQRRWLYRRGELAAELAEAVKVGLITADDAARLEAQTASEVAEQARQAEQRRAENDAWLAQNPPADAVEVGKQVEPDEPAPRRRSGGGLHRNMLALAVLGMMGASVPVGRR